ncbi:MAG: tetratricopeptide repeat protein, partial [Acidobacteriota bacterium]
TAALVLEIDPLQPLTHAAAGFLHSMQGRFEQSLPHLKRSLELEPTNQFASIFSAQALGALGRIGEAVATIEQVEGARPDEKWTWLSQVVKWGLQRNLNVLRTSLTPDRRAWCRTDIHYCLLLAEAFAQAGSPDDAFEWLDIGVARGLWAYDYLSRVSPFLVPLHGDPRWQPLMAHVRQLREQVEF